MVQLAGMVDTVNQISTEVCAVNPLRQTHLVNTVAKVIPSIKKLSARGKP